jgi:hypothetical protein
MCFAALRLLFAFLISCSAYAANQDPELVELADRISKKITAHYTELLKPLDSSIDCSDPRKAAAYLRALKLKHENEQCLFMAKACLQLIPSNAPGADEVYFQAGLCAYQNLNYKEAYDFFRRCQKEEHLYTVARFALKTEYEDQAKEILQKSSVWSDQDKRDIYNTLIYFITGYSTAETKPRIARTIANYGVSGELKHSSLFTDRIYYLSRKQYKHREALRLILSEASLKHNPHVWSKHAYLAQYAQLRANYKLSRKIYKAYLPFAVPMSWLPVEQNTYTYSELYKGVCRSGLLPGYAHRDLLQLQKGWVKGERSTVDALNFATGLNTQYPNRADVKTFLAHLYMVINKNQEAIALAWEAHNHCPYYNRAHRILYNIKRKLRNQSYADYENRYREAKEIAESLEFAGDLSKYVINWYGFSPEDQFAIKYSLRFWRNYVGEFANDDRYLYFKWGFQLKSDVDAFSYQRDRRIGDDVRFPNDNRLWDDVRGSGGNKAMAEVEEMLEAPYGSYNLVGHEVAHQFHWKYERQLQPCIQALYDAAKKRGLFVNPYAARNTGEYFAVAVDRYLLGHNAPIRYGQAADWLKANDPDLYGLLMSIKDSKHINEVRCPISIPKGLRDYQKLPRDMPSR